MKLDKAIKLLTKNYKDAIKDKHIIKPVAYALYKTWQQVDKIEEPRISQDEIKDLQAWRTSGHP